MNGQEMTIESTGQEMKPIAPPGSLPLLNLAQEQTSIRQPLPLLCSLTRLFEVHPVPKVGQE